MSPPIPASKPDEKTRFGLRFKILVGLTLFNTVATILFSINHYYVEKQRVLQGLEDKLTAAARALPDMLPNGYLDRAVTAGAVSPAEYRQVVDKLNSYCNDVGLLYLYSYAHGDKGFYCTSTNGTDEEMKSGSFTPYWDFYDTAGPTIMDAWATNRPRADSAVADKWGRTYSVFLPMKTQAGTRYIAGADLAIAFVDRLLARSLEQSMLVGLASFVLFFVISFFLSTQFSRNISRLAAYTRELTAANFESKADSPLRQQIAAMPVRMKDEVGQLARSFLGMEDRLGAYLRELAETTAAKERFQNELRIAGEIQASMLPHDFAQASAAVRVNVHATMKPAKEAGGDLYDCFALDENHLFFVIGDVSDKGMPAALFMAVTITILRAVAKEALAQSPNEILTRTNELLIKQNSMYQFVTVFLGIIDVRTGSVVYSDGGHNRPYLRQGGQPARMLPRGGGIALGVMPEAVFRLHTLQLQPDDTLILYTDGVTEAIAADDSFYGEARLETLLSSLPPESLASRWVEAVMTSVDDFTRGHVQADDITVLAVHFMAAPAASVTT
jgi:sigma-B regulation protein RsbU (phosphoserine phosphatase)